MRTIGIILRKEFRQIFRNKTMLPVIFVVPFVQLLILVNAATLDMKHIRMVLVDNDHSPVSRELSSRFIRSPFFTLTAADFSVSKAENRMLSNDAELIVVIPSGFERTLYREGISTLQLQVDAINGMTAGLINAYASQIISGYNRELLSSAGKNAMAGQGMPNIDIRYSFWYNPELKFKYYMVPGILVILLTITSMFLAALNLVREKEMGTIEQINVTPIHKVEFIIGKLIPFWVIALFELAFGLVLGKLLFNIPIEGSLLLLFGFAAVYLVAVLGLGLLISTMAQTQQQAMFLNFFFIITFVLMSGIFTPAESMPNWAQLVNTINPLAYFMRVIRMILLKGSGFADIRADLAGMAVFALAALSLATWRYRKTA
jgi:ABC-2 type transport system permease protein